MELGLLDPCVARSSRADCNSRCNSVCFDVSGPRMLCTMVYSSRACSMRPFGSVFVNHLSPACSKIEGAQFPSACFPSTSKPGRGGIGMYGSAVKLDSPLSNNLILSRTPRTSPPGLTAWELILFRLILS